MQGAIYFFIFLCLFLGLLYPCLALLGYDVYSKKSKTLTTIIRWRKRERDIWQTESLYNLLQIVAPLIPLSEKSERRLRSDLIRADIPYTPQEYYAKAFLSAAMGLALAVAGLTMDSMLIVVLGLLSTVYLFVRSIEQVKDVLAKKKIIMEDEIPTFIRSIESGLKVDRNIIHVIQRYCQVASPTLRSELELLLADMQASNIPQALMRFDSKMGSPEISRLCAALVEVDRGIDASLTLQYLATDMATMHRQLIQRELDKRPGKMKRAILPAALIIIVMVFYILIVAVISEGSSLGF